jgi:acyl phosphate:glycerol-3-phosphate acyltransferase
MSLVLWPVLAFACGSSPFAVWLGRLFLGRDIRHYGDANPGATNVLRAGSKWLAALVLLLDFGKGAAPVLLAHFFWGVTGWMLVLTALAPVLGHAFSPWLGWRGGKAVATTGGIWCGLTAWEGPTIGGILLVLAYSLLAVDGWAVLAAVAGLVGYLLVTPAAWNLLDARPEPWIILAVGLGNLLILAWKHRADLGKPLAWRRRTPHPARP